MLDKISIEGTDETDSSFLKKWLSDPEALLAFPSTCEKEVDAIVNTWMAYSKLGLGFTALLHGEPIAMMVLYLCPFETLKHQSEFSIIVNKSYRNNGVGSELIDFASCFAKEAAKVEWLYLSVYQGNPAINLYRRKGFEEFGRQKDWIKHDGITRDRILMQRKL